jgi:hypothetical protein
VQCELYRWPPTCSLDALYAEHHGARSISITVGYLSGQERSRVTKPGPTLLRSQYPPPDPTRHISFRVITSQHFSLLNILVLLTRTCHKYYLPCYTVKHLLTELQGLGTIFLFDL